MIGLQMLRLLSNTSGDPDPETPPRKPRSNRPARLYAAGTERYPRPRHRTHPQG